MNKRLWLVLLFILVLLLQPASALSRQVIIHSEDQFQFALQFMERGEYQKAVGELERFIHFFPEDERVPKARYLIGICYLEGKDYESSRKVLEKVHKDYSGRPIAGEALFLIGESYYRQGVSGEAIHYFREVIEKYPQPKLKNAALYRIAWSRMQTNRWREASETFKMVEKNSPLYASSQLLTKETLKGEALPSKDPAAAGILAAAIPGLGHAYCNRYKDGMVALLLNGLFIWAAVESFEQDHDVLGGILTFLELGWYSGNIYSALNSAHKYNRKVRNDFRRSLPDRLNLNLLTSRDGLLGLTLRIDF